jgi:hypothetical protein
LHLAFGGSAGIVASVFLSLLIAFQIRDHLHDSKQSRFTEIFRQTTRVIDQAKITTLPEALRQGLQKLPGLISRSDPAMKCCVSFAIGLLPMGPETEKWNK